MAHSSASCITSSTVRHRQPYTKSVALRAYDSTIRPIELGRRLLGVVDAQVADDTRGVPHAYTVVLHPSDRAAFDGVEDDLVRELAEVVTQHSDRESYRLAEPVVIVFQSSESTRRGSITVSPSPSVRAEHPATGTQPVDADRAEAVTVRSVAATMASPVDGAVTTAIVLDDGTRHVLDTERITIGRQSGCSIVIRDTNVSREHVQLRRRPHGWTVRDIGSTNGTRLNGVRVEGEQTLANGDIIMLGAIKVTFEIS